MARTRECAHIGHGCHHKLEKGIRLDDDALAYAVAAPVTGESTDKTFGSARNTRVAFSMNVERMLLLNAPLAIEMVFEERNVGLALLRL
jgi:hypothetical protein